MIVAALDVFVDSLQFIVDERELMLEKTWEHIVLSAVALLVSIAIAVPLGIALGHLHRGSLVAVNVANIGRALPTLVVIAVGFIFLGIGFTTVMLALVVLAVPPILTNAYVAVDEVDRDAVEAAKGMGMTPLPGAVARRAAARAAAPLRRDPHGGRLRRRDRDDRRDRRRQRSRRDPREPGGLRGRRTRRRRDLRLAARARRRRGARRRATLADAGRTERRCSERSNRMCARSSNRVDHDRRWVQ